MIMNPIVIPENCPICQEKLIMVSFFKRCPSMGHEYDIVFNGGEKGFETFSFKDYRIVNSRGLSLIETKFVYGKPTKILFLTKNSYIPIFVSEEQIKNFLLCA